MALDLCHFTIRSNTVSSLCASSRAKKAEIIKAETHQTSTTDRPVQARLKHASKRIDLLRVNLGSLSQAALQSLTAVRAPRRQT